MHPSIHPPICSRHHPSNYSDITWVSLHLKSLATRSFVQQVVEPKKKENIRAPQSLDICEGNPLLTGDSPHKGPVMWKSFSYHVIHLSIYPSIHPSTQKTTNNTTTAKPCDLLLSLLNFKFIFCHDCHFLLHLAPKCGMKSACPAGQFAYFVRTGEDGEAGKPPTMCWEDNLWVDEIIVRNIISMTECKTMATPLH